VAPASLASRALITIFFAEPISNYLGKDITLLIRMISILIMTAGARNIITTTFEIVADFGKYAWFRTADALSKLVFVWAASFILQHPQRNCASLNFG